MKIALRQSLLLVLVLLSVSATINFYRLVVWYSNDDKLTGNGALVVPTPRTSHRVSGLSCPVLPNLTKSQVYWHQVAMDELVYWRDIPRDSKILSPYVKVNHKKLDHKKRKYLTFEPDEGGWNNVRMAMETAVTMALIMGRTLVLPPNTHMYLLEKPHWKRVLEKKKGYNFDDFFHLQSLPSELESLEVITFQEFLEQEVMTGNILADPVMGEPIRIPENRTDWNGEVHNWMSAKYGAGKTLWTWWRNVTTTLDWEFGHCVAVFPKPSGKNNNDDSWISTTQEDEDRVQGYLKEILNKDKRLARPPAPWITRVRSFNGHPTKVSASPVDRLAEMLADRKELCVYNRTLQDAVVLHVSGEQSSTRFLVHFYAFLFAEDWHYDLWIKRFVRDHLRYVDEIQCAATRIVAALHEAAKAGDNPDGTFDSFHIRRGDFQYEFMQIEADVMYEQTRSMLSENRTVFIATDERNVTYFDPLTKHYRLFFLKDFMHLLNGVNPNYFGMIDQVVASAARTFVGTYYSTFSAYINRLRGYQAQRDKLPGYKQGIIDSYYYSQAPIVMRSYHAIQQGFWEQEFPVGWRDLDNDVEK